MKRTKELSEEIKIRKKAENKLLVNQYHLSKAQEIGKIGTWELDIQKDILTWTEETYKIFGVALGTDMNYRKFLKCVHPEDRNYVQEKFNAGLKNEPYDIEHRLIVNGNVKWVREKADIKFDKKDNPITAIGVAQDITDRKQIEETIRESERQLKLMIEKSPLPMIITDGKKNIEFYNNRFIDQYGYTLDDIDTKEKWWETCHPDIEERVQIRQSWLEAVKNAQASCKDVEMQEREWTIKDGSKRLCEYYMVPLNSSSLMILNDITEKKLKDDQIKSSLKEKETLLHEIHHRVKNNMQVINSLLKLQANNTQDDNLKEILKDSQSRVYAMSAIHETLHGSEKLSEIDLKSYLSKITISIFQTYSADHKKVKLISKIDDSPININQAYPLGLIINELISNSLKYAFPENNPGEIKVSINKQNKEIELVIMDDGVGITEKLDWNNLNTLGLKLVRTLVEDQLEGSINVAHKNGTKFTIKFDIEN